MTGLGIAAMTHAYDKNAFLEVFEQFKPKLQKLPSNELSCLLEKISLYLVEYLGNGVLQELNMAFKSIGQKYGFVSAGDVFRQKIADAEARADEEHRKAEAEKLSTAKKLVRDGVISVENAMAYFGYSKEQILAE